VSAVRVLAGRIADSPIELTGDAAEPADPVGPRALSTTVDFLLVAAGSAAVLTPFVIVFAMVNLSGRDPGSILPLGILASVVVPSILVARLGTPGDVASARAGFPPRLAVQEAPAAPVWLRTLAFVSDISAYVGLGAILTAVPVALALIVIVSFPVSFPMAIAAVGVAVAAFVMGRRPWATPRSPGLEVCGLRRVRTQAGARTVRASALTGEDGEAHHATRRRVLAALWLVASTPIVGYLLLINTLGYVARMLGLTG
jgi:hypothetical protein